MREISFGETSPAPRAGAVKDGEPEGRATARVARGAKRPVGWAGALLPRPPTDPDVPN